MEENARKENRVGRLSTAMKEVKEKPKALWPGQGGDLMLVTKEGRRR